jgi:hypothetical protein
MSTKFLRLESDSFSLGMLDEHPPFRKDIGNLNIYEVYIPPEKEGSDLGKYKVVIESPIENLFELEDRNCEAVALAEELEILWSYVWTTPLHIRTRGVTLDLINPPKGWFTNKEEIRKELDIEIGGLTYGSITFTRYESKYSNMLPLERALSLNIYKLIRLSRL